MVRDKGAFRAPLRTLRLLRLPQEGGASVAMGCILTNEWTPVREAYPPAGRVVLVVVSRVLKSGNIDVRYDIAVYNGFYWLDEHTKVRKKFDFGESITDWYMFEKYRPRNDD